MLDQKTEQFNKMMDDKKFNQPIPGVTNQPGAQSNPQSIEEQRILSQVQSGGPPAPVASTQGDCPQCGLIHPPIGPGEKCPNAPLESKEGIKIDVSGLVVKVKDILSSQLEQKNIEDLNRFTKEMVMALMKFCEEYKE